MALALAPITQRAARQWCAEVHRHLPAPRGDLYRVAVEDDGRLVGVGFAGRPVARMLQDGRTVEVTRLAVLPGHPNACSMLYGALRRAGVNLGWRRFVTYTLPEEGGASLRAAGWEWLGRTASGPAEWDTPSRRRAPAVRPEPKDRWGYPHGAFP